MRAPRSLVMLALVAPTLCCVTVAAPAYAVEADCKDINVSDPEQFSTERPSLPLAEMEIDQAWARLAKMKKQPGEGVVVAVIDSGVASAAPIDVVGRVDAGNLKPEPEDYHGTAVAGLIAGKPRPGDPVAQAVGIAPFARIFDVQVYDNALAPEPAPGQTPEESPITVANVVLGLDKVIEAVPTLGIRIVNMSMTVTHDPAIEARIAQLWELGVVVVAPTGNRPGEDVPVPGLPASYAEGYQAGEDAAPFIFPAGYPDVLAVNASMGGLDSGVDPMSYVMENSKTKVAAPTASAVSYSVRGESCVLNDPATSYAAAEVSGVLAVLQSAYDEPINASISRLLATADGRQDIPNPLVGAGEVQALDALTRPLVLDEDGDNAGEGSVMQEPQVLEVPEEPDDVLASTRRNAVWWGLLGGGVLLLALVLRPVLARRRRG